LTGSGWRTAALLLLKLAVSALLLGWILDRIGARTLVAVVAGAAGGPLVMAAALLLASHLAQSWLWSRLLVLTGGQLAPGRVLAYYFAGTFLNLVLPTGVAGDVARVLGAGRESGRRAAVLGATLIERLLGLGTLGVLGLVALASFGRAGGPELGSGPEARLVTWAVVATAAVAAGVLVLVLGPGGSSLAGLAGRRLPGRMGGRLTRLAGALGSVAGARGQVLRLVAAGFAIQSIRILAQAQVARALDIDVPLRYFFLFVPLLAVVVSLPVSIGGIGVRESMGALLFGLLGLGAAQASAMQLLVYLVALGVSLPGAGVLVAVRLSARAGGEEEPEPCR
jgi:uncharacterized membrane protein YbhN (UPF0104 family)